FQLDEERSRALVGRGDEIVHDEARGPATCIVLNATERLHERLVAQGVIPASQPRPPAGERPLCREVDLLEEIARVAVSGIEDLAGLGPVAQRGVEARRLVL